VGESDSRNAPGNPKPDTLQADVSDEVIQAALRSVEGEDARGGDGPAEVTEGGALLEESPPSQADTGGLQQELRETRAALDVSMERARDTLNRLKDSHDRHLRAAADLENYKKRALREREEVERFGIQKLLKELLPVMDNLDRALEHVESPNTLTEGIVATRRLFEETLGRYGVKAVSALGQPFDPAQHEAMQQVATADVPAGTVVTELVRGYTLHGRLVRPALVSVAVAPGEAKTPREVVAPSEAGEQAVVEQKVDGGANGA
jgi:molecular chaperone GrpE